MQHYSYEDFDQLMQSTLVNYFRNMQVNSSYTKEVKKAFVGKIKAINKFDFYKLKVGFLQDYMISRFNISLYSIDDINNKFVCYLFTRK